MVGAMERALDRHAAERANGAHVVSVITGAPPIAQRAWGSWAASRGALTLISAGASPRAVLDELLVQIPWSRSLPEARRRFAHAAGISVDAVDAGLEARSLDEQQRWIADCGALDDPALVSGWLLASARHHAPLPSPVADHRLLSIACDLATPIGVLLCREHPTPEWLAGAATTAALLTSWMPRHAVAVIAPRALVADALTSGDDSMARALARQGLIDGPEDPRDDRGHDRDHARSKAERRLHDALARDRRTAGRFLLNVRVPDVGDAEIDLLAAPARLAVEIDGWFHFHSGPEAYRRDRAKDVKLQRAGYFVMRFLAEDVMDRLELVVDDIAVALAARTGRREDWR